jgi:hypothetical protein
MILVGVFRNKSNKFFSFILPVDDISKLYDIFFSGAEWAVSQADYWGDVF